MFNKKFIRIVAIVLAALMLLGVFGAAISAFAAGDMGVSSHIPAMGQPSSKVPIIVGCLALIAAIVCIVISKKSKKASSDDNPDKDYITENDVEKGLNFFTSKKEDTYIEKPEGEEK